VTGATQVPWWRSAVVYQLYLKSFHDTDGDGIGDLDGVVDRLDHIASLGVDGIWLNPCYPSPDRDGGYDVPTTSRSSRPTAAWLRSSDFATPPTDAGSSC